MEIKLASQKWRQLQNLISQGSDEIPKAIDLDSALLGILPEPENKIAKLPDISSNENKEIQHTERKLPILSGILRNTDIHGRTYAIAVIDGHRLKENDRVQGFKILTIKEGGVVITDSGQTWFLSVPNVAYSRVHPTGVESIDSQ